MSILNSILTKLGLRKEWNQPIFQSPPQDLATLRQGLITAVAIKAKLPASKVDPALEFAQFGFDSLSLVSFTSKLEDWLQIRLVPTALWDHPTIDVLALYLAGEMGLDRARMAG